MSVLCNEKYYFFQINQLHYFISINYYHSLSYVSSSPRHFVFFSFTTRIGVKATPLVFLKFIGSINMQLIILRLLFCWYYIKQP